MDLADGLDLDTALAECAEWLKLQGSTDTLDARRAQALGIIARGEYPQPDTTETTQSVTTPSDATQPGTAATTDSSSSASPRRRRVVLYVHLSDAAITGRTAAVDGAEDGTRDVARLENLDRPVTIAQVRAWCATPDAQITVKPVIDLADQIRVNQYEIPDRIKEHVGLRDGGCAFPWCTRRAVGRTGSRPLDHDHVHPHATGGPTSTDNMTPLCRQHYRLKTHGGWQLRIIEPGTYRWRSPRGDTYLKDHTGTQDTGPPETPEPGD